MVMLDTEEVARRVGVQPRTITEYLYRSRRARAGLPSRTPNDLPEPDDHYAGHPVWKPATIDRWTKQRPGRGVGGGRPPASSTH